MKNVATTTVRPIKIQFNSRKAGNVSWARIRDASTGQILHTGQLAYIKQVAAKKYNQKVVG